MFLIAIPNCLNGNILSVEQWHNNVYLLYKPEPLDMLQFCNYCGVKIKVKHSVIWVHICCKDLS